MTLREIKTQGFIYVIFNMVIKIVNDSKRHIFSRLVEKKTFKFIVFVNFMNTSNFVQLYLFSNEFI